MIKWIKDLNINKLFIHSYVMLYLIFYIQIEIGIILYSNFRIIKIVKNLEIRKVKKILNFQYSIFHILFFFILLYYFVLLFYFVWNGIISIVILDWRLYERGSLWKSKFYLNNLKCEIHSYINITYIYLSVLFIGRSIFIMYW